MLASATGTKAANIYVVERNVPVFYPAETKSVPVQSILSIVLAVIIGGLLLFVVFRSMKPHEVVETEPELSVEALLATTKENQTLDDIEFSDKSASKQQIEKFVDENPEAVVALLRNWLNDDWEGYYGDNITFIGYYRRAEGCNFADCAWTGTFL